MSIPNKTFFPPKNDGKRMWFLIDCKELKVPHVVRIATDLLKGKFKDVYVPNTSSQGNYVILINTDLILLNRTNKHYIVVKPGRPGNALKIKNVSECSSKFTLQRIMKGMLSKTEWKSLKKRLKMYHDQNHLHQSQNPLQIL